MSIFDLWTDTIGIDPGSENLRIIKDGKIIFNEKALISYTLSDINSHVTGFGNTASPSKGVIVLRPSNYVISDFHAFEMLLRKAIAKGTNSEKRLLPKSNIAYISLPTHATQVEVRAYRDSAEHANSKEVYLIYQDYCSAVGMNVLFEKKDFILIDFSASKVTTSIFLNSKIVSTETIRMGTSELKRLISNSVRRAYSLNINDHEAQELLESDGWTDPNNQIKVQFKTLDARPVHEALNAALVIMKDRLTQTFEHVEGDRNLGRAVNNGIFVTGGASLLKSLSGRINPRPEIPMTFSNNPLLDNVNGLLRIMKEKEKFKDYLFV